ncbi:hypothetical protein BD311DRAFT_702416 [Dichomitus squalens]|uniref:Uncharacterized protein n=1 Tax=Dichomitus squalens TaxID=114155 RepID=A0A4Q9MAP0_9APHY|nr:hypothetical protein BD311DRAFT_702416 [Dichomitus squalens]
METVDGSDAKYENDVDEEGEEDLLADYFEKSASAVRQTFGRFEQDVVRPVLDYVSVAFHKRPIRSTFIAFYLALSILPVLSFIGFSVFIVATSIFVALAGAILFASSAISFFGFWLACTLIFFAFVSFNLTLSTLATYLFTQFAFRARTDGARLALASVYADARAQLSLGRARGRKPTSRPLHTYASPAANIIQSSAQTETDEGVRVSANAQGKNEGSDRYDTVIIVDVGEDSHSPSPSPQDTQRSPASTGTTNAAFGEKVPGIPVDGSV